MMLPIFFLCAVVLASAEHTHKDVGEYGYYNTWRKAICEKNDQNMFQEMEDCFQMEHQAVLDATHECAKLAAPESEGKTIAFVNAGCKEITIFKTFDECFEEYEKDEEFRKLMEITPEMDQCYEKIFEKYAMDSLRNYLKDYMESFPEKNMMLPIFFLCAVVLASAEHNHTDVGEYEYYNSFRKAICEKNDQNLFQEMEDCFQMEHQAVVNAYYECSKLAAPESEGKTVAFVNAGCKEITIFKTFDECFKEYEKDEEFKKQMEITPEIEQCYNNVLIKYGLDSFRTDLNDD